MGRELEYGAWRKWARLRDVSCNTSFSLYIRGTEKKQQDNVLCLVIIGAESRIGTSLMKHDYAQSARHAVISFLRQGLT